MKKPLSTTSAFFKPRALIALLLCAAATACCIFIPISSGLAFLDAERPVQVSQRTLSFQERVSYQRAIEGVYWRHRIWPKENANPKPSLNAVMSQAQIEKKVADYLRNSQALEDYWQRPIIAEQLQAELDRMAKYTKQPEVLQELFDALGNDPFVIAECLARPSLAERLVASWYAYEQRIHGHLKQRAEAELQASRGRGIEQMKQTSGKYSEIEFAKSDNVQEQAKHSPRHAVKLNSHEWDQTVPRLAAKFNKSGSRLLNGRDGLPGRPASSGHLLQRGSGQAQVAPYQTLPVGVLSSLQEDENRYYATAVIWKSNDHLKLATVSWLKEPFESWLTKAENQVPDSMIAPGANYILPRIADGAGCVDDTWIATAGPPDGRQHHTGVWTGSEMIIWGGELYTHFVFGSGERYNPSTDSWTTTSAINTPAARAYHTAVWTGTEMIVWGGLDQNLNKLNTGGRYNPETNDWTATSTTNAPSSRLSHTAVWTGSEMIVWGGSDGFDGLNTGGKYNPNTDSWVATSTANVPDVRTDHTAVWTGNEMIIWGDRMPMALPTTPGADTIRVQTVGLQLAPPTCQTLDFRILRCGPETK